MRTVPFRAIVGISILSILASSDLAFSAPRSSPSREALPGLGLRAYDGSVAEVAIDFILDTVEIGVDGRIEMVARGFVDEEEVGFMVQIAKPTEGVIALDEQTVTLPSVDTRLTIRSIAAPSNALLGMLNHELRPQGSISGRLAGEYNGRFYVPTPTFEYPSILYGRATGVAIDDEGAHVNERLESFFDLTLFFDAPRRRLTLYVGERAAYGGSSSGSDARRHWLRTVVERQQMETAEPGATDNPDGAQ